MLTAYRTRYGAPDVLSVREVANPEPGPGDILVRVHAATVNRTDCGVLSGKPYVFRFFVGWPRPPVGATGTDFAGEVVAVGGSVREFRPGDRVMGFHDHGLGTHAELVCMRADRPIQRIPPTVGYAHAAASLEGAHYAINFITKVQLRPGDSVLVNGATGAIGSAAVALLAHRGMRVTAVAAGPHLDRVSRLGAARVIDFTKAPFVEQLQGERFPVVFDAVGKSTFGICRALLPRDGVYLSSELGPYCENPMRALLAPFLPGPKVRFPVPVDIRRSLRIIDELLRTGWCPMLDRHYDLHGIRDAFAYVASGQKIGNVVLALSPAGLPPGTGTSATCWATTPGAFATCERA